MIDFETDPTAAGSRNRGSFLLFASALAIVILLNSFAVLRWTRLDTRPLAWDEAVHTQNTYTYLDRITSEPLSELMKPVYFNYPPLYNLSMIPFLTVRADIADAGSVVNLIYLAALVIAVFLIGQRLMDPWSGLAAAMLVGFYPLIVMMARTTMIDLALTAWVSWGFYALMRCEDFSLPGWSAAFGAVLGFGMLTKWTAFIYLAGPALPAVVGAVRTRKFRGLILATVSAFVVMSPWYLTNFVPMVARVSQTKNNQPAGGLILSGWANALWYPIGLFEQLNVVFLVVFAIGLVFSFRRPELRRVLLWFFVSIAMFSLINNKNTRYSLPAVPAVALLSVSWIRGRAKGTTLVIGIALAFFMAFNFLSLSPAVADVFGVRLTYFDPQPPLVQDWKHREIIETVDKTRDPKAPFTLVTVVSNAPYFHSTTMNITARRMGADKFSFRGVSKTRWLDFSEFVLLKTGDIGPEFTTKTVQDYVNWLASPPDWFKNVYRQVGRWPLPDGSDAVLYHAEPEARSVSQNDFFKVSLGEVEFPNLKATNVEVNAVPIATTETAHGRLAAVQIRCATVTFQGFEVSGVDILLDRPQINLPRYRAENEVQLLSLERLAVHGTIHASTILDYARIKLKWLKDPRVSFEGDDVRVGGKVGPVRVEIKARLALEPDWLKPRLERLSIAGIPLPTFLFRALTDKPLPLAPNREWPFRIDLGKIDGQGDTLKVGS